MANGDEVLWRKIKQDKTLELDGWGKGGAKVSG